LLELNVLFLNNANEKKKNTPEAYQRAKDLFKQYPTIESERYLSKLILIAIGQVRSF
jgi:hypothetical protein